MAAMVSSKLVFIYTIPQKKASVRLAVTPVKTGVQRLSGMEKNTGYRRQAGMTEQDQLGRQVGMTFEERYIAPSAPHTLVKDAPVRAPTRVGIYEPAAKRPIGVRPWNRRER